ncbi:hypothetical protein HMPREF1572_00677 [Gardnerella vaginalis JCP7275]|nr:hypothetical protein HMPREF1572_00677 [Gardnerella vaginalis JCP7275]
MPNRKKFKQNDNNLAVDCYRYSSHYRFLLCACCVCARLVI